MNRKYTFYSPAVIFLLAGASAYAQVLATGDSRTVAEPKYPAVCATLTAQFSSSQRSSPPTSDDTSRLQNALTNCAGTGKSVVLAATGAHNAFFTNSLSMSGTGLVVNSGVTLYGNKYNKNANLLRITGPNAFLMGPGAVDGRGDLLSGTARLVQASNVTNFIVYNVTLAQSIYPNLYVEGGNGFTAWAVNIRTPANRHDADGIDIDSFTNATVNLCSINAGDDGVAVKSHSGNASNVTVSNTKVYGTHGLTIGSVTSNTVSNVLFENSYVYGVDLNGMASTNANAVNVKVDPCSLSVKEIYYKNICVTEVKHLIVMNTNYNTCSGGGTPSITDVVVNGLYATKSVTNAYSLFSGINSATPVVAYLANVMVDVTKQQSDQYATVYLDNSNDVPSGTGVTTHPFTLNDSFSSLSCKF